MLILLGLAACAGSPQPRSEEPVRDERTEEVPTPPARPPKSRMAQQMDSLGLTDLREADSTILVSLMYTRADNFTGEILYTDLHEAYLHPDAAQALTEAQRRLKALRPDLTLAVFDAARPMSVQQKMWDAVKGTAQQNYVSNPARGGGMHNYGVAVDITLATLGGDTLPMGTRIDHLGEEAHTDREEQLVRRGRISPQARENRMLLRRVMQEAGFRTLPSEWWHFNLVNRQTAREKYKVIP